jgi:hypothetical protein
MLYTVEPGDTLLKITEKFYGNRVFWQLILDANPDVIVLLPGIRMLIPLQCHYQYYRDGIYQEAYYTANG